MSPPCSNATPTAIPHTRLGNDALMKAIWISAAVVFASCAGPQAKASVPDRYFLMNQATSAQWLHLRADGSFAIHSVHHMFSELDTTGTWVQVSENRLSLTEAHWLRDVVSGSVRVSVGGKIDLKQLPFVRGEIEKWLKEHPGVDSFSKEELERVGQWDGETVLGPGPENNWTCMPLFVSGDTAPRADVEGAVRAIDAYFRAEDKQTVPVLILRGKGRTFLHWPAGGGRGLRRWSLAEISAEMNEAGPGDFPVSVYVESTKEEFEKMTQGREESDE